MKEDAVHSETRERIIKSATTLFARKGYDATSIRDIINLANVNLGAVTYHFGGKEQLLMEVIALKAQPLRDIGTRILKSRASSKQKLLTLMREFALQILCRDPDLRLMFAEGAHLRGSDVFDRTCEAMKRRNDVVITVLREGMADGSFRPCDVDLTAWLFFGIIMPYVMHHPRMITSKSDSYPPEFVEQVVDNAIAILFEGLVPLNRRGPTKIKKKSDQPVTEHP